VPAHAGYRSGSTAAPDGGSRPGSVPVWPGRPVAIWWSATPRATTAPTTSPPSWPVLSTPGAS